MSMCSKYFIVNDDVKEKSEFDEKFLTEGERLYEVIKVEKGVPLFLEKHLNRLHNSSNLVGLNMWISDKNIKESLDKLIHINNKAKGSIKFILNFKYKVFICFFEENVFPKSEDYIYGVKTAFYHKERINPNAKVLNLDFRKDVDKFIYEKNVFEAILVDKNGDITEGSKSNIFMISKGKLITTPIKAVLPGTTRSTVLEICKKLNIQVVEKYVNHTDIDEVEGMFLSSTPFDVLPISKVDDKYFQMNENKEIQLIMNKYREIVQDYITNYAE